MNRPENQQKTILTVCSMVCLVAGSLLSTGCDSRLSAPKTGVRVQEELPVTIPDPGQLPPDILQKAKQATVLIGNFEGGQLSATGSGFVTDDGRTILTAKHVVTGTDDEPDVLKVVYFAGTDRSRLIEVPVSAIYCFESAKQKDPKYYELDVAAIKVAEKTAEPLKFTSTSDLIESTIAWGFGFPHGSSTRTLDKDLPSCTVHSLRVERVERTKGKTKIIQLSGSPTYGDSGGPVILRDGSVIGVIQAKDATTNSIFVVPEAAMADVVRKASSSTVTARQFASPIRDIATAGQSKSVKTRPGSRPVIESSGRSVLADKRLTESDLAGLTAKTLTVLRNEPFARRGYIFRRRELRQIFQQYEWYSPRTSSLSDAQRGMSSTERYNVDFIRRFQKINGLDW